MATCHQGLVSISRRRRSRYPLRRQAAPSARHRPCLPFWACQEEGSSRGCDHSNTRPSGNHKAARLFCVLESRRGRGTLAFVAPSSRVPNRFRVKGSRMASSFKDSLVVLARARFPVLYVETFEERRVLAEIRATMDTGGLLPSPRPLHTWSITTGLVDPEGRTSPGTADPLRALDAAQHTEQAATFIFLDLHAHLEGNGRRPDPALVRKLREVSADFQCGIFPRTLIIVAPTLNIPPELEKDVHILDFPLPDESAIRRILDNLIEANAGNARLRISLTETDRDRLVRASLGLTESEAEGALALAMASDGILDASDVDTVLQEKKQAVRKNGLLEYIDSDIDLDGVGGLDNLKRWLLRRDSSWLAEAENYGIPAPRGVLITGVPGCGKSLTAKAVAATWHLPLLRLDIGKVFSGVVGSSEFNLRTAIRSAEAAAPAVLWVDEIEKGFAGITMAGIKQDRCVVV